VTDGRGTSTSVAGRFVLTSSVAGGGRRNRRRRSTSD